MTEPRYCEWPPPADLAAHVACVWYASVGDAGLPYTDRVLPDACVDVIWDGARLFVAGPDTGPELLAPYRHRTFVGLRTRPGRAAALLGCPAPEVRDERPELAELRGRMRAGVLASHRPNCSRRPRNVARSVAAIRQRGCVWTYEADQQPDGGWGLTWEPPSRDARVSRYRDRARAACAHGLRAYHAPGADFPPPK